MFERLIALFHFRDVMQETLTMHWSDETRKELETRLDEIKKEIATIEERRHVVIPA